MKKNLFFLATATALLASCSSEDVIELNNGNAIDFRAAMGVASRGEQVTNDNINQFLVTAIDNSNNTNYFTDELFKKKNVDSKDLFVSASEYFWPGTHQLKFFAYSYYSTADLTVTDAATNLGAISIDATAQKLTGFSPNTDVAKQVDFVSATAVADNNATDGILLSFNHNLIQAQVKAKTANTTYEFEINGIRFGNIVSKGDFNFADSKWTLSNTETETENYTINYTPIKLDPAATEAVDLSDIANVKYMMLLPQTLTAGDMAADKKNITEGAYIAVSLKITLNGNQIYPYPAATEAETKDYDWAYVPLTATWDAGNRYVYTLDFSRGAGYDENGDPILGDPITFTATVEGWDKHVTNVPDTDMHVPTVKND